MILKKSLYEAYLLERSPKNEKNLNSPQWATEKKLDYPIGKTSEGFLLIFYSIEKNGYLTIFHEDQYKLPFVFIKKGMEN